MGAGVDICLEQGADLHMAQLMPLPLTVSCFSKIQIGFTFLVLAHLGSPRQRALKRCVCVHVLVYVTNMVFQWADKFKGSWMHPRSGHWHLIDFVLTRQRDLCNIRLTRVMHATTSWSDHWMVRTSVFLTSKAAKDAAGPAHHGLGSSPVDVPVDDAIRRIR